MNFVTVYPRKLQRPRRCGCSVGLTSNSRPRLLFCRSGLSICEMGVSELHLDWFVLITLADYGSSSIIGLNWEMELWKQRATSRLPVYSGCNLSLGQRRDRTPCNLCRKLSSLGAFVRLFKFFGCLWPKDAARTSGNIFCNSWVVVVLGNL